MAISPFGKLLGCGQIKPHNDGSHELASIAVQVQFQRQGVAQSIIQGLLALDLKRPLFLMCRARLGSFYVKFGFHAIGQEDMPAYFRRISCAERIFNSKAQVEDRLLVMRMD